VQIVKTPDKIDGEYTPKCRSATRRRLRYGTRCNPDRRARPRSYSGSSAHRPVTRSQKRRLSDGMDEDNSSDSDDSKNSYAQYSTKRVSIWLLWVKTAYFKSSHKRFLKYEGI